MLDVGFSEILLTSAIALIVLGPERLPKVARQVGNWLGRARIMARQLSEQLEREVNAEELLKQSNKPGATPSNVNPSGAVFDPAYNPTIAPPGAFVPPAVAPRNTSVAAMHANDPKPAVTDAIPPNE